MLTNALSFLEDCLSAILPLTLVENTLEHGKEPGQFVFTMRFADSIESMLTFKQHRLRKFAQDRHFVVGVYFNEVEEIVMLGMNSFYDDEEIVDDMNEIQLQINRERISEADFFDPDDCIDGDGTWFLGCRRSFDFPANVLEHKRDRNILRDSIRRQLVRMCFEHIEDSMAVLKTAALEPALHLN